jgi:hypothetical protein
MPDHLDILALCGLLERGEIDGARFLEGFTRALAAQIGCSRAGVWVFDDDADAGRLLHCIAMYDATLDLMVQVTDIVHAEDSPYFEALLGNDCVVAPNARSHPATIGFLADYLLPLNIHSLLDVCFSINGVPFGIFSCEQIWRTGRLEPAPAPGAAPDRLARQPHTDARRHQHRRHRPRRAVGQRWQQPLPAAAGLRRYRRGQLSARTRASRARPAAR